MALVRGTLSLFLICLAVLAAMGVSGAYDGVLAQEAPSLRSSSPARQENALASADLQAVAYAAPGQAQGPQWYFHAGLADAGSTASTAAGTRLIPSGTAARSFAAQVADVRSGRLPQNRPATLAADAGASARGSVRPSDLALQIEAIAATRGLETSALHALIDWCTNHPPLGLMGEPTVNLRLLNMMLDDLDPR